MPWPTATGEGGLPRSHARSTGGKVARLRLGAAAGGDPFGVTTLRLVEVNGQPGAPLFDRDEQPVVAIAVDIADDLVQTIRPVSNPRSFDTSVDRRDEDPPADQPNVNANASAPGSRNSISNR
jgi:hypothetical protein